MTSPTPEEPRPATFVASFALHNPPDATVTVTWPATIRAALDLCLGRFLATAMLAPAAPGTVDCADLAGVINVFEHIHRQFTASLGQGSQLWQVSAVLDILDALGGKGIAAVPADMCWNAVRAPVAIIYDLFGPRWRCRGCQQVAFTVDLDTAAADARRHAADCRLPVIVACDDPAAAINGEATAMPGRPRPTLKAVQ